MNYSQLMSSSSWSQREKESSSTAVVAQPTETPSKHHKDHLSSNWSIKQEQTPKQKLSPTQIIDVWSHNLIQEMNRLAQFLITCSQQAPKNQSIHIAIDTEFPGVIHRAVNNGGYQQQQQHQQKLQPQQPLLSSGSSFSQQKEREQEQKLSSCSLSPSEPHYRALRANVNQLKLIQLGLCFTVNLSDNDDNDKDDESSNNKNKVKGATRATKTQQKGQQEQPEQLFSICWQFNFQFDLSVDAHADKSIRLLQSSGMDFERHASSHGIPHQLFADMFKRLGLLFNPMVTWLSFHGAYDFAYLMKLMNHDLALPETESDYLHMLHVFFPVLLDVKHVMRHVGGVGAWRNGGLNQLARELHVERCSGSMHQAGSDSVLTSEVYFGMRALHVFRSPLVKDDDNGCDDDFSSIAISTFSALVTSNYSGILYGLGVGFEAFTTVSSSASASASSLQHQQFHPGVLSCWTPGSPGASRYDAPVTENDGDELGIADVSTVMAAEGKSRQSPLLYNQSHQQTTTTVISSRTTTVSSSSSNQKVCWWSLPDHYLSGNHRHHQEGKSRTQQNNKKRQSTRRSNHNTMTNATRKMTTATTATTTNPHAHEPSRIPNQSIKLTM